MAKKMPDAGSERAQKGKRLPKIQRFGILKDVMIKTINVAGIQLDNYTVRESIMRVDKNLNSLALYTIEEITMDTLLLAESDERVKEVLGFLNQTIIAETGILDAVDRNNIQHQHEIEEHAFFYELMKRLERNRREVFLLGETEPQVQEFSTFIQKEFPRMQFAGMVAMESCIGTVDAVVNEINAATPYAIISTLPSPHQEHFLLDNRDKLSASLWYGAGNELPKRKRHGILDFFQKRMRIRTLEKHITDYEEQEENSK